MKELDFYSFIMYVFPVSFNTRRQEIQSFGKEGLDTPTTSEGPQATGAVGIALLNFKLHQNGSTVSCSVLTVHYKEAHPSIRRKRLLFCIQFYNLLKLSFRQ